MSDTELLIEAVKTLPASRVAEVLDFVEFIKQKETRGSESANSRSNNGGAITAFGEGEKPAVRYKSPEEMLVDLDDE